MTTTDTTTVDPDAMAAVADAAYPGDGGRPVDHVLIDGNDYIATDKRIIKMYRADHAPFDHPVWIHPGTGDMIDDTNSPLIDSIRTMIAGALDGPVQVSVPDVAELDAALESLLSLFDFSVGRVHLLQGLIAAGDPVHYGDGPTVEAHCLYVEVPSLVVNAPWKITVDAQLLQSTVAGLGSVDLHQAGADLALGLSDGPHTRMLMPIKKTS